MPTRVAIIGAGIAGLGAAYALRPNNVTDANLHVEVFEKSRGYGGRATTRRRHGARYDHGANYFKIDSDRLQALIHDVLPADELTTIDGEIWTFEADGRIQPGDPGHNQSTKWTYRMGISYLGKLLADAAQPHAIHTQVRIQRIHRLDSGAWRLETTEGASYGPFEAVVLTPPSPQSIDLLEASDLPEAWGPALVEALGQAQYQPQYALMYAFDAPVPRPERKVYALLNLDRAHPIAWLGFEEDKPGHVPEVLGSLLVAQMSPAWTKAHYDSDREDVLQEGLRLVTALLGTDLPAPVWTDAQRWRYALPTQAADVEALQQGQAHGVFFAGDGLVGKGRVHQALESGLDTGAALSGWLRSRSSA
ncbi:MAG: FAD-dependent oxidoreductase [Bacteroidota bacterium]